MQIQLLTATNSGWTDKMKGFLINLFYFHLITCFFQKAFLEQMTCTEKSIIQIVLLGQELSEIWGDIYQEK